MGQEPAISPSQTFIKALRAALNHLYDPDYLRQSLLARVFGVDNRFDTPSALQRILAQAIETLQPGPTDPNRSQTQSIYELLLYRYIQQSSQDEIANQFGISVRHLRRQQNQALEALACRLWEQYHLEERPENLAIHELAGDEIQPGEQNLAHELDWLKGISGHIATEIASALPSIRTIIQPLADQHQTEIRFPENVRGMVAVHPVAFQQILLNLLSLAVQRSAHQRVSISVLEKPQQWVIDIAGMNAPSNPDGGVRLPGAEEEQGWLDTVRNLVHLSAGAFEWQVADQQFCARIIFRPVEPVNVLVIDDNPEMVTMMERFVEETRYHVIGVSNPNVAIERALEIQPALVVVDIMMPQVDGLQVLSRLKHHPIIGKVPVIVCSVLPQKGLAASLGASGFIQKPVQRDAFVNALDGVMREKRT